MNSGLVRFLLGLAIGLAVGMIYGWIIRPVEYVNTSPDTLRVDYRADYVLMAAEAYAGDGDLTLAQVRLAALGPRAAEAMVLEAIEYGIEHGFSQADLERLNRLAIALRSSSPTPEIGPP